MENNKTNNERKCRFSKLNFNLKNEIFEFIQLNQIFEEVFYIDKSFSVALKNIKRFDYIKNNLKILIHDINFTKERINDIRIALENYVTQKKVIYEICAILLNKKHKKNSTYTFDGNTSIKKAVIFKFISNNRYIKRLNLRNFNCQYKEKTTKALLEALLNCKSESLHSLAISKNKIGKQLNDSNHIITILKKYNRIIEFDLEDNELGFFSSYDFKLLFEGLSHNDRINTLNISENYFCYNNENHIKYLHKFVKENNSLRSIYIRNSSIGMNRDDIYYLSKIISKENSTLKELDLSENKLGNEDNFEELKNLFYAITDNKSLSDLNLSGNALCRKDNFYETNENNNLEIFGKKASNQILKDDNQENIFLYICNAIGLNNHLVTLDLSNNNVGNNRRNMSLLKKALTYNKKLKKLILLNNYFESKDQQELKELIKKTNNKITLIL